MHRRWRLLIIGQIVETLSCNCKDNTLCAGCKEKSESCNRQCDRQLTAQLNHDIRSRKTALGLELLLTTVVDIHRWRTGGGKKLVDSIRPLTTLITGFLASSCCNPCHATLTEASGQLGNALETNKRDLACYRLGSCWSEGKEFSWNENCIGLKSFIERAYFAGGSPAVREPHLCHSISALQTWFLKNSNSDPSWSFPGFSLPLTAIECQENIRYYFYTE